MDKLVKVENNKLLTDVQTVCKFFNKNTFDVNKAIRKIIKDLPTLATEYIESTYINSRNQKQPTYLMTQKGFSILCMGFTGKNALIWKSNFYDEFERMKSELEQHNAYLNFLMEKHNTVCVSDICAKFQNLTARECNMILKEKGIIERRSSGWYPTNDYKESKLMECAYAENGGVLFGYVRYTPKGETFIINLLLEENYKLVDNI